MQVIPEEIKQCVVFIYYKNEQFSTLCGTGFFVSVPLDVKGFQMVYLVTAKHVIKGIEQKTQNCAADGKVYMKVNLKDKGVSHVSSELSEWKYHPIDESVDVAILNWSPPQETFDYKTIPKSMATTEKTIKDEEIGAGDEVFLTGLFSNHTGTKKNLPIIRTGNIALMPEEKVHTNSFGAIDAYLIEARSIGGLSGSPVFVYLGNTRVKNGNFNIGGPGPLFSWMGVMHGHWDIDENGIDSNEDSIRGVGKNVNMGIGIVIPATKVIETLDRDDFIKERKDASDFRKKKKAPTEGSIGEKGRST